MKISIIADIHLYAPNEIKVKFNPDDPNEYCIGDVFDLANCKNKEVSKVKAHYEQVKKAYKGRWVDGNHERISLTNDVIFPSTGVVIAHGDFESWGPEKAVEYRSKSHGAGAFKRKFIVGAIESFEKSVGREIDEKFIKNAVALAKKYGCHTYIAGHLHPKEIIDTVSDDIRIVIVPRGKSEVEI